VFQFYKGAPVIRTGTDTSASFGVIFMGNANDFDGTLRHEWGHNIQFMILGSAAYTGLIAIPSVASFKLVPERHHEMLWERTADSLSEIMHNWWP